MDLPKQREILSRYRCEQAAAIAHKAIKDKLAEAKEKVIGRGETVIDLGVLIDGVTESVFGSYLSQTSHYIEEIRQEKYAELRKKTVELATQLVEAQLRLAEKTTIEKCDEELQTVLAEETAAVKLLMQQREAAGTMNNSNALDTENEKAADNTAVESKAEIDHSKSDDGSSNEGKEESPNSTDIKTGNILLEYEQKTINEWKVMCASSRSTLSDTNFDEAKAITEISEKVSNVRKKIIDVFLKKFYVFFFFKFIFSILYIIYLLYIYFTFDWLFYFFL